MKNKLSATFIVLVVLIIGVVIISSWQNPLLSREYVNALIESKGVDNISWSDFDKYSHQDIGSGNYIYQYRLSDGADLYLSGADLDSTPTYIYIVDESGKRIDLKN